MEDLLQGPVSPLHLPICLRMVGRTHQQLGSPEKPQLLPEGKAVNLGSLFMKLPLQEHQRTLLHCQRRALQLKRHSELPPPQNKDKPTILSQPVNTGKNSIIPITKRQVHDKVNTLGYKLAFWNR